MVTVKYRFALEQKVTTPFGQPGIIVMLGTDDGGSQYSVLTKERQHWFKESALKEQDA